MGTPQRTKTLLDAFSDFFVGTKWVSNVQKYYSEYMQTENMEQLELARSELHSIDDDLSRVQTQELILRSRQSELGAWLQENAVKPVEERNPTGNTHNTRTRTHARPHTTHTTHTSSHTHITRAHTMAHHDWWRVGGVSSGRTGEHGIGQTGAARAPAKSAQEQAAQTEERRGCVPQDQRYPTSSCMPAPHRTAPHRTRCALTERMAGLTRRGWCAVKATVRDTLRHTQTGPAGRLVIDPSFEETVDGRNHFISTDHDDIEG
jgi:hypothetical protein